MTIEVPADDGAIQRAFEELDARMDAWLSVMHRIEQVLRSGVGTCVAETVGDAVAAAVASAGEAVDEVAVDSASDEQAGA
ncbi:MAG: hypothetical protein HY718_16110, partial [Planctomycetes bacterium]|nr:hypothetical protein [Planctomycetota bacterium]